MRKIVRSLYESARDVARNLGGAPEYLRSRKDWNKVEILFAHPKRNLKLERLRGPHRASDESHLAAAAQIAQDGDGSLPAATGNHGIIAASRRGPRGPRGRKHYLTIAICRWIERFRIRIFQHNWPTGDIDRPRLTLAPTMLSCRFL